MAVGNVTLRIHDSQECLADQPMVDSPGHYWIDLDRFIQNLRNRHNRGPYAEASLRAVAALEARLRKQSRQPPPPPPKLPPPPPPRSSSLEPSLPPPRPKPPQPSPRGLDHHRRYGATAATGETEATATITAYRSQQSPIASSSSLPLPRPPDSTT